MRARNGPASFHSGLCPKMCHREVSKVKQNNVADHTEEHNRRIQSVVCLTEGEGGPSAALYTYPSWKQSSVHSSRNEGTRGTQTFCSDPKENCWEVLEPFQKVPWMESVLKGLGVCWVPSEEGVGL